MSRGEKINNPLNIRLSDAHWLGKMSPSSDPDFEQFSSAEYGIRAGAKILLTYFKLGIDTITGIIERWAPPSENPTAAYIENVCNRTGFDADAHLLLTSLDDLWPVIKGMIDQEQGEVIYSDEMIKNGCRMALGLDIVPETVDNSNT